MFRFIYIFLITFLITACSSFIPASSTQEPARTALPSPENTWGTIKMTHSGGIMGLSRSIEISSNGAYSVTDDRNKQTKQGQLSQEELKKLKQLITSLEYVPNDKPYGCADCFVYEIEISGTGKPFKVQVDDVTIEESGLAPLVTALRAIIDRELN